MGRQRVGRRPGALTLALGAAVVLMFAGCGYGSAARAACADAVLADWTKGTLDSSYSPNCYEAAIDALPEDLRAYTSAADDIERAAISASRAANVIGAGTDRSARQLASEDRAATEANPLRSFPTEVAVLGGLLVILAASGIAASVLRRRRGR